MKQLYFGCGAKNSDGADTLRHEGACRLLVDDIPQTQRYLNVTDEELRRGLE